MPSGGDVRLVSFDGLVFRVVPRRTLQEHSPHVVNGFMYVGRSLIWLAGVWS